MNTNSAGPQASYGVLNQTQVNGVVDRAVEELICMGYSLIPSGMDTGQIGAIADSFDRLHKEYVAKYGHEFLESLDEHNTIRMPLAFDPLFMKLAANQNVHAVIARLISGKFVLNQQNGILNPAGERYNQASWHRDLPYQHFVSSRPLAINALYCVDDFTSENGATYVLAGSHRQEAFPSDDYVARHAIQISAQAGSFILLDCMTFHRGGFNHSRLGRRAVNQVYTIPFIRQQIDIPAAIGDRYNDHFTRELLGFRYSYPRSIDEYLVTRKK